MTMFFSWRYLQTTTPLPVCGTDTPMGVCVPLQTTLGNPPVRLNWDTRLVLESDTSTWGRSRSSATDHGDCKNPTPAPCGPNRALIAPSCHANTTICRRGYAAARITNQKDRRRGGFVFWATQHGEPTPSRKQNAACAPHNTRSTVKKATISHRGSNDAARRMHDTTRVLGTRVLRRTPRHAPLFAPSCAESRRRRRRRNRGCNPRPAVSSTCHRRCIARPPAVPRC